MAAATISARLSLRGRLVFLGNVEMSEEASAIHSTGNESEVRSTELEDAKETEREESGAELLLSYLV